MGQKGKNIKNNKFIIFLKYFIKIEILFKILIICFYVVKNYIIKFFFNIILFLIIFYLSMILFY